MNRLYIISSDVNKGSALATMNFGLSDGQFKVLTSLEDVKNVPNKCIFMHDENHPVEAVQMTDELISLGGLNLKDRNYVNELVYRLYQDIQTVNSLFEAYRSEQSTNSGIEQIKSKLTYRGITIDNGFDYTVGRARQGYFFLHANSDRMEILINLYVGYVNNVIKPSMKMEGFKVGKPIMSL